MRNLLILALFMVPWSEVYSQELSISPKEKQPGSYDPSKIVILPHPDLPLDPAKTVIWCGTVQLAWNEMITQMGGKPELVKPVKEVDLMNQQDFTKADLDEASYFVTSGTGGGELKKKIAEGMALKFPDLKDFKSRLAEVSNAPKESISSYAFMRKNLSFEKPFYSNPSNAAEFHFRDKRSGSWGDVAYRHFGLSPFALSIDEQKLVDSTTYSQVQVLNYVSQDECVVKLKTKDHNEELILASIEPKKTLKETIAVALHLIREGKPSKLTEIDTLDVPVVDLDVIHSFSSLANHPLLKNPTRILGATEQAVKLSLTETGAKLISEAASTTSASNAPYEGPRIVNAIFDQPFLLILKRRESKVPYLACWVGNTETFKSIK